MQFLKTRDMLTEPALPTDNSSDDGSEVRDTLSGGELVEIMTKVSDLLEVTSDIKKNLNYNYITFFPN